MGGSTTQPDELYLWKYEGERRLPEKVSNFNDVITHLPLSKLLLVKFKSFDGKEIEGGLMLPPSSVGNTNTNAKANLPTVLLIHGGPTGRWEDGYNNWAQALASAGYAVFMPNIRGSSGYGFEFINVNRADWGGGDFKDVMAAADYLVAQGIADPKRLGIAGWSYGGYMSAWAVTQTDRFRAAVSGAGMFDLATEFGTEDHPSYDEWFWGLPWEKPEGFRKSSPQSYVKNAKTPTLILQGEADTVDPLGQSTALYRALKRYGVDTELVIYPREPHGLQEEKHLTDRPRRLVEWFDRHMK